MLLRSAPDFSKTLLPPNMRIPVILTSLLLCLSFSSTAQYFEGKLEYISYFLDKQTLKPLFDGVPETVTVKGAKIKVKVQDAQQGQLDWQIDDYKTGTTFYRKSYKNTTVFQTDKPPTRSEDGKLIFQKPDSPLVAPILRTKPCDGDTLPMRQMELLDTIINVHGYDCSVVKEYQNGKKTAEYYCYPGYRLDPAQYQCNRKDNLDHIYRFTGGQLITQMVSYGDLYTLIYQLQKAEKVPVDEKEFEIPKGIPIRDEKGN
jgi:hypothetical protein